MPSGAMGTISGSESFCRSERLQALAWDDPQKKTQAHKAKGIRLHPGVNPAAIEETGDGKLRFKTDAGSEIVVDNVMLATGRKPNSQDLGLEEAGVAMDPRSGKVIVDEHSRIGHGPLGAGVASVGGSLACRRGRCVRRVQGLDGHGLRPSRMRVGQSSFCGVCHG